METTKNVTAVVQTAIERHGTTRDALIPILTEVNDTLGYLTPAAMTEISQLLHVPGSQLYETVSFYRMLSTKPRGQHVVQFCESAPCHVMGGRKIWPVLKEALGLEAGETSADGRWTLLAISCPGVCGVGPVMMIDDEVYGNLTPERIREILALYEQGGV
ncbi:MAG: NADH-quinone oxidoreductase subunit NuoE [Anaerolineae bacterium]|nr:NADH-quinone oxidoreductase subunit NuoE [Anaerolineae bacterium]